MKKHLLLTLPVLFAIPAAADNHHGSWLNAHGVVNTDQVLTTLGTSATTEQRATIDSAVHKRNEAVAAANVTLSGTIRKTLGVDDDRLAAQNRESARLEAMKRNQPMRYNHLKRKLDKEKAAN